MKAAAHAGPSIRRFSCRLGRHDHTKLWCRECHNYYWVCNRCGDHK